MSTVRPGSDVPQAATSPDAWATAPEEPVPWN
jgi:hypothetical protein